MEMYNENDGAVGYFIKDKKYSPYGNKPFNGGRNYHDKISVSINKNESRCEIVSK